MYYISMKVYRYLSESELNLIRSGGENLGNTFDRKNYKRQNNHRYRKGVKYIHFYKQLESMEHIRREYIKDQNQGMRYYFCSFNVPATILALHRGKGHYDGRGYDEVGAITSVEYAIPADKFDPAWLDKVVLDDCKICNPKSSNDDIIDAIIKGTYRAPKWGEDLEL